MAQKRERSEPDTDPLMPSPPVAKETRRGGESIPGEKGASGDTSEPRKQRKTLGKYTLKKLLGEGGMGAVYLAVDTKLDRQVALKIPKLSIKNRSEEKARFLREAKLSASVRHPNICAVHEADEIDGIPYLAVAYIDGETLAERIKRDGPLPIDWSVETVRKIAQAMEAAHSAKIIHRDLKPENIMIDRAGEPIVMDFGLAYAGDQTRMTKTGALMGTPAYMSIEQANGEWKQVGPLSDQYSLGVILYEMLTQRVPFDGPYLAILGQLLTKPAPAPRSFRSEIDPQLEAIVLKAMAKDAKDRYPSMGGFAKALADWLRIPSMFDAPAPVQKAKPSLPPTVDFEPLPSLLAGEPNKPKPAESTDLHLSQYLAAREGKAAKRGYFWPIVFVLLAGLTGGAWWHFRPGTPTVANIYTPSSAPEPDPVREATYTIQLSPAEASLVPVGVGAEISGTGKQRKVRISAPDPDKPITLEADHKGYRRATLTVNPTPGEYATRTFTLEPMPAYITVNVIPSDAKLYVDNVLQDLQGQNREVKFDRPDGVTQAVLKAVLDSQVERSIAVTPKPGEREIVDLILPATYTLNLQPPNVKIYINGVLKEFQGPKREVTIEKPDGVTQTVLRAVNDRQIEKTLTLNPKPGERKSVDVFFLSAIVRLTVGPPDSEVSASIGAFNTTTGAKRQLHIPMDGKSTEVSLRVYRSQGHITKQLTLTPGETREIDVSVETNTIGMQFEKIPAGEFQMGADGKDSDAESNEKPAHRVSLSKSFLLGIHEVTQEQFKAMMGRNPSYFNESLRQPVENVSWYDAVEFCNRLSKHESRKPFFELTEVIRSKDQSIESADVAVLAGSGYRLPTEAEWEYACRAGTTTRYHFGDTITGKDANFAASVQNGRSLGKTSPVGSYEPNAFGLFDMHGNVREWCYDWHDADHYKKEEAKRDPQGPLIGAYRVLRGGSWVSRPRGVRSSYRYWSTPGDRDSSIGFRVARTP